MRIRSNIRIYLTNEEHSVTKYLHTGFLNSKIHF